MKIKIFLLSALFVCFLTSNGQQNQNIPTLPNRGCATPVLPQQFETWLQGLITANTNTRLSQNQIQSIFNIPVIVHVIHNNEAVNNATATIGGNLNAAQIIDQINILNKDYNGLNADTNLIPNVFKPRLGKFQFNFCLAVVNPTGGILAEPGIDRINRVSKGWNAPPYSQAYVDGTVKPNSIWNPGKYMNIWVCGLSGGILGYATFPAPGSSGLLGLSPPYGTSTTDGVVIRNNSFGSIGTAAFGVYNKGRTATHEVGHWLSLRHIWGDGACATDYCNDTPPAQNANYNCPNHPYKLGVCTGNTTGEMFMNYMDYTDDACMYMFSNDQKNRAQLIMTNSPFRLSLLTSTVCSAPTVTNDIGIMYVASPTYSQIVSCNNVMNPVLVFFNYGSNVITSATLAYNVDGINGLNIAWNGSLAPSASVSVNMPQITNLSNGPHSYNVGVSSPNGGNDANMLNNYSNQPFSIVNSFTMSANGGTTICSGSSATLTANGTASGYTWNPGSMVSSVAVVSPTASTIYTLSGNSGTCINTRTVSVNVSGTFYTINSPGSICSGSSATISAFGAISYLWSTNSTASFIVVSPSTNTSYSLSLSNGACNANTVINISVMSSPSVTVASTPSGSICIGSSATLTATGATSYSWNGGPTGNIYIVTPTVSTVYNVVGSNSLCSGTSTFGLLVGPSTVTLSVSASQPTFCSGGSVTITASGATSYLWNTGAGSAGIVVSPSATAGYTVTGTTGACNAKTSITVTMIPTPTVTVTAAPGGSLCPGGTATITASGAGSYSWNTGTVGNVLVVSPSVSAIYSVTGSNSGCLNTKTISVPVGSSSLTIVISPGVPAVCTGDSITLLASGANTYTWNTGSNSSGLSVTPTINTVYSVTGINGACSASAAVTVSVVAPPVVSIIASPNGSVCAGTAVVLTATGANNYTWNVAPNGVISPSLMVTPTASSIYTVTGSNLGCSVSNTIAVAVGPGTMNLSVQANPSSVCAGKASTISVTGANSYTWNTGSSNSSIVVTPTSTSSYTVTGGSGGCTGNAMVTVSVIPAPQVTISIQPADSICPGKTATLTANGPYTSYAWTGSAGSGSSIAVSPASTSTYVVLASGGGCSVNASTVIFVRANPVSTLVTTHPYCDNQCAGIVNASSSGGLAPYSYNLTVTNCTILPCTNLCPGLYTLYTKDAAGCASFNIFSITCKDVTGIRSADKDARNLQIYPNPATYNTSQTMIIIELQGANFSLLVYNGLGQLVISTSNNYNKTSIDIDRLAKGVYMFEVNTGSEKLVRKVVVY